MANDKQRRTVAVAVALVLATVGLASMSWKSDTALETGAAALTEDGLLLKTDGKSKGASPSTKVNDVASKVSSAASHVASGVSSVASNIQSGVSSVGSAKESFASSFASGVSSAASSFRSGVSSFGSDVSSLGSSIASGASSFASSVGSSSDSSSSSSSSSDSSSSSSNSLSSDVSSLEDELSADSEGDTSMTSSDDDRIDELANEITELEDAQDLTEARLSSLEDDAEALAKVSGFEIERYKPANGYRLAGQVIEYRGRTKYELSFNIKQFGTIVHWGNILNVGDTSGSFRSPGLWTFPRDRRLHIRQRAELDDGNHAHAHVWNRGCDPATAVTPPIGTEYAVNVVADHQSFRVYYNSALVCTANMDVLPPPGQQSVWIGVHHGANAEVTQLKFQIH